MLAMTKPSMKVSEEEERDCESWSWEERAESHLHLGKKERQSHLRSQGCLCPTGIQEKRECREKSPLAAEPRPSHGARTCWRSRPCSRRFRLGRPGMTSARSSSGMRVAEMGGEETEKRNEGEGRRFERLGVCSRE
ncbi:hypothetical protein ACFX11_012727 [Malus domestica]